MPVKKMKKPKKARAPRGSAAEKKKGLKQKQKQKQVVNVQVSSGGSGGGGYVPIPQAPEINYALLANLIKPAATVDVPIRAAAPVAEMPFVRPAEPPSLASETKPKRKYTRKEKVEIPVAEGFLTGTESERELFPQIDLRGSSGKLADKITDFASNPAQEFLVRMGKLPSEKK